MIPGHGLLAVVFARGIRHAEAQPTFIGRGGVAHVSAVTMPKIDSCAAVKILKTEPSSYTP